MAADIPRVYRDSCIFIHALKKTPEHYSKIISIENEARDGRLNIYVSSLVIAEVAWFEKRKDITEEQYHLIARYFQHKFMRVVPVDRPVAKIAAEIVRNHELHPPIPSTLQHQSEPNARYSTLMMGMETSLDYCRRAE